MKYTLAFACSQDGFIAKHSKDNPFEWTSREDQKHLQTLINDNEWQVMGRTTHELNPNESRKRIVFSRQFSEIKQIKEIHLINIILILTCISGVSLKKFVQKIF
jgi:dihydrofolate reductase